MNTDDARRIKITADMLAARDHMLDPATTTHERVRAQIWRTFRALGHQGGLVLTSGDGCATVMGLTADHPLSGSSVMARVDKHDNAVGPIGSLNDWNESECFDAVVITLAGYDERLTYGPNIVRRRADQLTDATLALAITKPGGLTAVIASHSLMDSPADHGRRDLAALADLVGAVRFPAGIYRPATGTDEVVDLLLFRRRESGAPRRGHDFEAVVESRLDGGSVTINTYFDTNVDQVLGSTQYDPTGARPTNLTVVGSRTLFPGVLTTALNDVIAFAQRAGLTTGPRQRQRPGAPLPMRARRLPGPHRQAGPGLDGP